MPKISTDNWRDVLRYAPELTVPLMQIPGLPGTIAATGQATVRIDTLSMYIDTEKDPIASQNIFVIEFRERSTERFSRQEALAKLRDFVEHLKKQGIQELRFVMPTPWEGDSYTKWVLEPEKWQLYSGEWELLSELFATEKLQTIVFDIESNLLPTASEIFCKNLMRFSGEKKVVLSEKIYEIDDVFCRLPQTSSWKLGCLEIADVSTLGANNWTKVTNKLLLNLMHKDEGILESRRAYRRWREKEEKKNTLLDRTKQFWEHFKLNNDSEVVLTIRIRNVPSAFFGTHGYYLSHMEALFRNQAQINEIVSLSQRKLKLRFDLATDYVQTDHTFGARDHYGDTATLIHHLFHSLSTQVSANPCIILRLAEVSDEGQPLKPTFYHIAQFFPGLALGIIFSKPETPRSMQDHIWSVLNKCFPQKYPEIPHLLPPKNPVRCAFGLSRWMTTQPGGWENVEIKLADILRSVFSQEKFQNFTFERSSDYRTTEPMWDPNPVQPRTKEDDYLEFPEMWLCFIVRARPPHH